MLRQFHLHGTGQVGRSRGPLFRRRGIHQGKLGHQPSHADGGLDEEGIVRHDGDALLHQAGGDKRAFRIATDQDGHVGPLPSPFPDPGKRVQDLRQLIIGKAHFHRARRRVGKTHILPYIPVQGRYAVFPFRILAQQQVQFPGRIGEESIVEVHNLTAGAVVAVQRSHLHVPEFFFQTAAQEAPVSPAPAIDALFDIAHNQGIMPVGLAVQQQGPDVFPLDIGRVLKLVQEEVLVADPHLLINKRGIRPVDNLMKEGIAVVDGKDVLFPLDFGKSRAQPVGHAQAIQLPQQGLGGGIHPVRLAETGEEFLQRGIQHPLDPQAQGILAFGKPQRRIRGFLKETVRRFADRGFGIRKTIQLLQERAVAVPRVYARLLQDLQTSPCSPGNPFFIVLDDPLAQVPEAIQLCMRESLPRREALQAAGHLLQPAFQGKLSPLRQVLADTAGEPVQQGAVGLGQLVQDAVYALCHQRFAVQLHLIGGKLTDFA